MKTLIKILKPYWFFVLLAPTFVLLESVLELLLPTIMIDLVESGNSSNKQEVIYFGVKMSIFTLVSILSGVIGLIFSSIVSQKIGTDIRREMFEKIQSFSINNIDTIKAPSIITRLTNDVTQIQILVTTSLRNMSRAIFLIVGSVILAYTINTLIASLFIVATLILAVIMYYIMKKSDPLFQEDQERLDDVNATMRESLAGIRVVKAFVREDFEINKFSKVNEKYRSIGIKSFKLIMALFPIFMIMLNGSIVVLLYQGGFYVYDNKLRPEEITALITYLLQMMNGLMLIASSISQILKAKTSVNRIDEILNTEIDLKDSDSKGINEHSNQDFDNQNIIEFKNVNFKYKNSENKNVLNNISFEIKKGETLGILGETGAGKSTLVNLLIRLYDVTYGEILFKGKNIKEYNLEDLHCSIAMVLQNTILFTGTIYENILWGKKGNEEDSNSNKEENMKIVINSAKQAQAHDFIMKFPNGYETLLGQKGVNLSGGQKQRISIARSLMHSSEVIIFDDSTSAVDTLTEFKINQGVENYHKGASKIVIAQRISSVINLDKIIVMHKGEIVGFGKHSELLESNKFYQDIYYSQKQRGGVVVSG